MDRKALDVKAELKKSESGSKRPLDDDRTSSGAKKMRGHIAGPENDEDVQVRVLIPGMAVGALIGKGGETMRQLKNESGCRLKMSKNEDMYPGTQERVFMMRGKVSSCMIVIKAIIGKIREKVGSQTQPDQFDQQGVERAREMKIVVPNTSAGMVIGKSGTRIKEIRDLTGATIQVFPKQGSVEAQRSGERVITVVGKNSQEIESATQKILEKVASDPHHDAQTEPILLNSGMNFDDYNSPFVSGPPPSGPPRPLGAGPPPGFDSMYGGPPRPPFNQGPPPMFGGPQQGGPQQMQHSPMGAGPPPPVRSGPLSGPPPQNMNMGMGGGLQESPMKNTQNYGMNMNTGDRTGNGDTRNSGQLGSAVKFNPMEGTSNMEVLQFLDSLQMTLRTSGFTEAAVAEIMQAMQVLSKYNIMGLGLGLGVAAMATMRGGGQGQESNEVKMEPYENMGRMDSNTSNQQANYQSPQMPRAGTYGNSGPLVKELPQLDPNRLELEVPDSMATSILSQKSKTAQDIQHFSGVRMDVAKNSAPGNPSVRIIQLFGEKDAVRAARVMIERAVNDEHGRRQRQMTQTSIYG